MLNIMSHQQLQALEDEVEAKMGLAYIRLDWMPENEEPFEAKAFALRQLKAMHKNLCNQHVHAPTLLANGKTSSVCPYCSYGHANVTIGTDTQHGFKFGVSV